MNLTQRQKRVLQWAGYPLLALVVFLFALQLTFPYERVKDKLVEMLSEKYDVSIVSAEPTFLPGGIILETVVLQTRPTQPDEEATTLLIDELRVEVGLLALLGGQADVDITAAIGGGSIDGNVVVEPDGLALSFATEGLPLETVPGLRGVVGLPMKGGLDASLDLTLPEQRWDLAKGSVALSCNGCTVGDGQAKIKPGASGRRRSMRTAIFASQGVTVPELKLGTMNGKISIADGRGVIEALTAKSDDGDLTIAGAVRFGRTFKETRFEQGCMKFRLTEELKQREPNFGNVPALVGVALQEDGYANLLMKGNLLTMRWLPAVSCEEDGSGERLSFRRGASRPSIPPRGDRDADRDRGEPDQDRDPEEMEPGEEMASPPPTRPPPTTRPDFPSDRARDGVDGEGPRGEFPPPITPVPAPSRAERTVARPRTDEIEPPHYRREPDGADGDDEELDDEEAEEEMRRREEEYRREEELEEEDEGYRGDDDLVEEEFEE